MNLSENARKSLDEVLSRDDVILSREVAEDYISQGYWSEKSAVDFLDDHVRARPHATALVDESGHRWSFRQFDEASDAFALNLISLGFEPGDFLGLQLPNWSEFFIAVMGAIKAKVMTVNFHLTYRAHELTDILGRTQAKGLVVPTTLRGFDYEALAQTVKKELPSFQHIITTRGVPHLGESISFHNLLSPPSGASKEDLESRRPNGFDPLLTLVSSGTTGRPKLVMHIHNTAMHNGPAHREVWQLSPEDRWAVIAPVGHSTAVMQLFLCTLGNGSPLVLLSSWRGDAALELFAREGVTHAIGATPLYADLLRQEGAAQRGLALRLLVYGGAPMPEQLARAIFATFGSHVAPLYGYSESGGFTTFPTGTPIDVVAAKVGKPVPGCTARLVDEMGNDVPLGEPGEFWAKGPNIAVGYYGEPERTKALMTEDGYFKSGDMLVRDEEGYYRYAARKDDIINRGGQKIDPKEVEDLLFTHPKVKEVVLIGASDPRLGEVGVAFVVPQEEPGPTLEELKSYLEEKGLARWKWPEQVVLKNSIPVNPSGKIMRFSLRDEAAKLLRDAGSPPQLSP